MNTASQSPQTTIQDILSTIIDITPAVIARGMEREAASLAEIKQDLRSLADTFAEPKEKEEETLRSLAKSSRENLTSVYYTFFSRIRSSIDPSDSDLQMVRRVMELYINAHDDYLRYKEACHA